MTAAIGHVLEVLDRQQRVVQRVRLRSWPVTLGRGYGCDIILDDPHVAPAHVRLDRDAASGALTLTDLGTHNGVCRLPSRDARQGARAPAGSFALTPGEWIETGRTRWRLCDANEPVAAELPLQSRHHEPAWLVPLMAVLAFGAVAADMWFNAFDEFKPLSAVSSLVTGVLALAVWAGLWGLLTRIFHAPSQFGRHFGWACTVLLAAVILPWPLATLAYALDWPPLVTWQRPIWAVAGAIALLGHVSIAFGRPSRRAWAVVGGLLVLSLGLSTLETWQNHRQLTPTGFMTVVRPPGWQLTGGATLDAFYRRAASRQTEIDALRAQEVDGAAAEGD